MDCYRVCHRFQQLATKDKPQNFETKYKEALLHLHCGLMEAGCISCNFVVSKIITNHKQFSSVLKLNDQLSLCISDHQGSMCLDNEYYIRKITVYWANIYGK